MSAGTPADVRPGGYVRVRLGSFTYHTTRMTLDEAQMVARRFRTAYSKAQAGGVPLVPFPAEDCVDVDLVVDKISAIEVRRARLDGHPDVPGAPEAPEVVVSADGEAPARRPTPADLARIAGMARRAELAGSRS